MECPEIPELIELDSYNGDYSKYEDAVYFGQPTLSFINIPKIN